MNDTLRDLKVVFRQIFENPNLEISASTTANDVQGWDSLSNMLLIAAIEKHFNIKLSFNEVRSLKNVGNLVDVVEMKLGGDEVIKKLGD